MTVLITYPHSTSIGHNFHLSLVRTVRQQADLIEEILAMRGYPGDGLIKARNEAMRLWLDDFQSEYLWTIDTDIGFRHDTLPKLLEHKAPVVSGLYRTVYEDGWSQTGAPGDWRIIPAAYDWTQLPGGAVEVEEPEGVSEVGAVGAGCLLVRRDAALAVRERYGDNWWTIVRFDDGRTLGEDFSFCWRLKECGIPILLDADVRTSHHKAVWV